MVAHIQSIGDNDFKNDHGGLYEIEYPKPGNDEIVFTPLIEHPEFSITLTKQQVREKINDYKISTKDEHLIKLVNLKSGGKRKSRRNQISKNNRRKSNRRRRSRR